MSPTLLKLLQPISMKLGCNSFFSAACVTRNFGKLRRFFSENPKEMENLQKSLQEAQEQMEKFPPVRDVDSLMWRWIFGQ